MQITRADLFSILQVSQILANKKFNIDTQYKILKLKKVAQEEKELYDEQVAIRFDGLFKKDENGNFIMKDGGYMIEENKQDEVLKINSELLTIKVTVPDIYFSLDELKNLDLTLDELAPFMNFIK